MNTVVATENPGYFSSVMGYFFLCLLTCTGGMAAGLFAFPEVVLSSGIQLLLIAVTFGMAFFMHTWARSYPMGFVLMLVFAFVLGLTTVPLLAYALSTAGMTVVFKALVAATGMYAGLALFGLTTTRNLHGLGMFAFATLIGLIVFALVGFVASLFGVVVFTGTTEIIFSSIGILVFAAFTAYDFQNVKNQSLPPVMAATVLFMNFIFLFRNILHLMTALNRS